MRVLFLCLLAAGAFAQEAQLNADEKRFQDSMTNVTMAGYFTSGDKAEPKEDKYTIERATKVKDDLWKFEARIQYNNKDVPIAMTLPVKWAGDTPVISLTDFAVPGFGKFTARVLIYGDDYAGTWGDAKHGGKLFGKIVRRAPASK
jgi:hypothetical protein